MFVSFNWSNKNELEFMDIQRYNTPFLKIFHNTTEIRVQMNSFQQVWEGSTCSLCFSRSNIDDNLFSTGKISPTYFQFNVKVTSISVRIPYNHSNSKLQNIFSPKISRKSSVTVSITNNLLPINENLHLPCCRIEIHTSLN